MRQVALDTETTGLSPKDHHRIIEIGCVEMINRKVTGKHFHSYIDPERQVDAGAFNVHGISTSFLKGKPKFETVLDQLITFIQEAELIIHNAPFDVGFINHEFSLLKHNKKLGDYCSILDTLILARERHPGQKNSLDALCKRYGVDNSSRQQHGALLDAHLLLEVYLRMTAGEQGSLFAEGEQSVRLASAVALPRFQRQRPLPIGEVTPQEQQAHNDFLELLKSSKVRS